MPKSSEKTARTPSILAMFPAKIKKKTAEIVGVSVASVTKYLDPNYVSKAERKTYTFDKEPTGCDEFIKMINMYGGGAKGFCKASELTEDEKKDLIKLQKEIYL